MQVPVNARKLYKNLSGAVAGSLMLPSIGYVRLGCHLALRRDVKAGVDHEEVRLTEQCFSLNQCFSHDQIIPSSTK